jgi:ABC-2 type transport system permease protein
MRNSIAIAKKELNIYFTTPIAYVMFTLFVVIGSYYFVNLVSQYELVSKQYQMLQNQDFLNRLNFQDVIFRNIFGFLGIVLVFIVPFLTMRLIAEEKRSKTIELLFSTPVTPLDIVFGKYLAALGLLVCALGLTLLYPLLVAKYASSTASGVEWRSVLLGYLGLFLLGGAFMALGLFVSALTESQVVAAIITFVLLLMLWIIGWAGQSAEGTIKEVLQYLGSVGHLDSFSKGIIDLKDLVYFVSLIVLGLFATHRAVEAHRWS